MEANEKKEVTDFTCVSTMTAGTGSTKCAAELQKGKEEDIVAALLEAANFRNDEELVKEIELQRNGKLLFTFRVRPLSDEEIHHARRMTRKMYPNPAGKKFPKIEGEVNVAKFNSRIIFAATVDEDREQIWGQRTIMEKYDLIEPWETVGVVLTAGEKNRITDIIMEISGMTETDDDDDEAADTPKDIEDYAKN